MHPLPAKEVRGYRPMHPHPRPHYTCAFFVPAQINLKLILVSGKTAEFLVTDADTVTAITQHVFDNWPSGMCLHCLEWYG